MEKLAEDVMQTEPETEVEQPEVEQEGEQPEAKPEVGEAEDDGEVIVTIGEDSPPTDEDIIENTPLLRDLRKRYREMKREKRELEEKLKATQKPEPAVKVGQKPTLESCDWDAEAYEQNLAQWYEQKRKAEEVEAKAQAEAEAQQKAWQSRLDAYAKEKTALKVRDFDDAEAVMMETFSQIQQGIIVQGAENSALMIYALGKNPKKAKELSEIKDPVKFAFAVAKLENILKVSNRKPPAPERTITGTGRVSGAVDSTLERLREEAARTGDYTKVTQFKRLQREKSK